MKISAKQIEFRPFSPFRKTYRCSPESNIVNISLYTHIVVVNNHVRAVNAMLKPIYIYKKKVLLYNQIRCLSCAPCFVLPD